MSESICLLIILDVFLNDSPMGSEYSTFISSSSHPRFKFCRVARDLAHSLMTWRSTPWTTYLYPGGALPLLLNYPLGKCSLSYIIIFRELFDVILSFLQYANQQLSSFQIGILLVLPFTFHVMYITAPFHHAAPREVHHELAQLLRSSERSTQRDDDNRWVCRCNSCYWW